MNRFAEFRLCHRLIILVEQLAINFQSGSDRLRRHMPIKSSFDYLGKCAGTTEHFAGLKAERDRVLGKSGPLQQLRAACYGDLALVSMDFDDAEVGQLFRDQV